LRHSSEHGVVVEEQGTAQSHEELMVVFEANLWGNQVILIPERSLSGLEFGRRAIDGRVTKEWDEQACCHSQKVR
jgi:hypothetical protein